MNKKILFFAFNLWVAVLSAADSTAVVVTNDSIAVDTAVSVMSGIFTVGDNNEVPKDGKITVKEAESDEIAGIYHPNKTTGKYLFILPPGKTYSIKYEAKGTLYKSENLIVPMSTMYQKIHQKINLGIVK
jgi:hypothetical protein